MIKYLILALSFLGQLFATDCRSIISRVEKAYRLPTGLLLAIAKVESSCRPYAISHGRHARYFNDLSQAVRFIERVRAQGRRNFNVGCMQLNFPSHRRSFENAYEMLHPEINIGYAAQMIRKFYRQYGSWERAVKVYNCGNPNRAQSYWNKILRAWR